MFKSRLFVWITLAGVAIASPVSAVEEPPVAAPEQVQPPQPDPTRGSRMMSPEERAQHREKMRSLKTEEERKAYREEHHKKMQERAKEKGLTLPDQPGQGPGMGGGRQGRGGPPR